MGQNQDKTPSCYISSELPKNPATSCERYQILGFEKCAQLPGHFTHYINISLPMLVVHIHSRLRPINYARGVTNSFEIAWRCVSL